MGKNEGEGYLLARVNFPLYSVKVISERHILVAGGGGQAKTGIANTFEIYELIYDKENDNCRAIRVTHHDTGRRAIMTAAVFEYDKYVILASGGMDGMCLLYKLKYTMLNGVTKNIPGSRTSTPEELNRERHPTGIGLRRRRTSSMSNHGDENDVREKRSKEDEVENGKSIDDDFPNIGFEIGPLGSVQADFNVSENEEPFLKIIRYSRIKNVLVTGGADGHIRAWMNPELVKVMDIMAHKNEIDDLDVNPNGTRIVTVSKDGHGYVWNIENLKQNGEPIELEYNLPVFKNSMKRIKYNIRSCRYGIVEGDANNFKLFTILNPVVRNKPSNPTYLCKWNTKTNIIEKLVSPGNDILSTMTVSDDGRFVGIGTLTGSIEIYIGFSLKKVYRMSNAHNIFVTGLEFLKVCKETQKLTGDKDCSLVSISVDNHIAIHHIPKMPTVGFISSIFMMTVTLFLIYLLMDILGI